MVNLFRKNMAVQALLILVALILLWLRQLITPQPMLAMDTDGILYTLLQSWLSAVPRVAVIIAMILVLAEGLMLNILLSDIGLVPQTTLLPTLLYIILMSAPATTITPMLMVNAALIASVHLLMLRGTLLTIPASRICSVTSLIGLCSLFYIPSLALIISYLFVAISFRLYNWRDIVAMLLGLFAPYLMLVTVLFMADSLPAWWSATTASLGGFAFSIAKTETLPLIANIILGLIAAAAIFTLWSNLGKHPVLWQKNASTVMLLSVGGIIMLFYSHVLPMDLSFFAISFALCGTHMLLPQRNVSIIGRRKQHLWIYDIILILTIAAAIVC